MDVITFAAVQADLADTMESVCVAREPVIITRGVGEPSVVMMPLEDFKALEESAYLLRSPRNARRLFKSIASLEAGRSE